jgi:hypothetical protein
VIDHRTFLGSLVMGTLAVPSVASAQPGRGSSRIFSGRSRDLVFSAARVITRPPAVDLLRGCCYEEFPSTRFCKVKLACRAEDRAEGQPAGDMSGCVPGSSFDLKSP